LTVKVTVVIPVYNPGPYIEPCIDSLVSQTLAPAEIELLFVNDGSTDDSLERLERHAGSQSQVKIITIPNSGWPGKPRNVGTDAALGEYVMYVDQDDRLEPQSLERMYEMGAANAADVILGKVISDFRGVNHALYRSSRPRCTVHTAPLMNSLTPHKMLRTAFLREHGIRYPEGPRRLEDQLFMTKAYFAARSASIVADYVCYRYLRRPDGKNAGSKRIVPAEYYGNLDEVLDVVDANTDRGEIRDGFYRRFLRTEMLGRLDAPDLLRAPPPYPTDLLGEIRGLMARRFPITVDLGMGAAFRCRAALTRDGTLEAIAAQAESIRTIRVATHATAVEHRGGALSIDIEGRLRHGGSPLTLDHDDDLGWLLPEAVTAPVVDHEHRRVEDAAQMSGDAVVKHRELADEWFLPTSLAASIEGDGSTGEVVFRGTAVLDPQRAAGGSPLRKGIHDLFLRLEVFGVTRTGRLSVDPAAHLALPVLLNERHQINRPYVTAHDKLSVNVDALPKWLAHTLQSATFVDAAEDHIALDLGTVWTAPPRAVTLTVTPERGRRVSWTLHQEAPGSTRWQAPTTLRQLLLPVGEHSASVKVAGPGRGHSADARLQAPFRVTPRMRRAWLLASLRQLPARGIRRPQKRVTVR